MTTLLPLIVLLLCTPLHIVRGDDDSTSSFVITANPISSNSNPRFDKVWEISASASGSPADIANILIDLPGQVFVSFVEPTLSKDVLGVVTVSGRTAASVDTVAIGSKTAMKGEKLVLQQMASTNSTDQNEDSSALLTTVQLLRKSALKKVVTRGSASVVISDNVLFTKKKDDYKQLSPRKLEEKKSDVVVEEVLGTKTNTSSERVWAIKHPSGRVHDTVNINLDLAIPGYVRYVHLARVDSDLLPEGAIGTITVYGNETLSPLDQIKMVTSYGNNSEVLQVQLQANSTRSESEWCGITVYLAPNVVCETTNATDGINPYDIQNDLNVFPVDDMVTILLNGTGNIYVDANESAMYLDDTHFQVSESGVLQVVVKEVWSANGIKAMLKNGGPFEVNGSEQILVIKDRQICMGTNDGGFGGASYLDYETDSPPDHQLLCQQLEIPPKLSDTSLGDSSVPAFGRSAATLAGHAFCKTVALLVLSLMCML